ncbi:hypothetical protein I0D00_17680 [Pseudomonas lalucatii]|uniref:Uncharacterized protein n=1 Tax=Pseudomonas lalucatii TaxID=1424203 RepID=A0ABS5Q537_9PSED|nr:hypothetical protein [Pseudomonas lalucatii]MBS7663759.1 hypothetical protein [Pseudomonas lalucatii]MBS7689690.1 hypothetical protein [Pseudomonas lalucatii]MBS7725197.1 hypothetical protein [Pseudomonas lalucatii]QVM86842.1 hypothetical protein I0D68_14345 [Pseudomonas lalucatii]
MELNRELLNCMTALRRRLREEQALDIHLNQADALDAMLCACLASNDEDTRRLGQRLARCSERAFEPRAGQSNDRGQAPPAAPDGAPGARPAAATLRIYRGQRVYR